MKIAIISNHFSEYKGGAEFQSFLYSQELKKAGHSIFFLSCAKNGQNDKIEIDGDAVYHVSPCLITKVPLLRNGDIYYFSFFRIGNILREEHADAILEIGDFSINGVAAFFAKRTRIPYLWICASDRSLRPARYSWKAPLGFFGEKLMKYGIAHASACFLQNEEQIKAFKTFYPDKKYDLFPNLQPTCAEPVKQEQIKYILWVANLKPMKRPEAFLDLAEGFVERNNVRFIMIGRDNYVNIKTVRERVSKLPNMEYLGEQSQTEVNKWLEKAFLLVNTSEYEGFSNTFVQAWMRKTPVITLAVNPSKIFDYEKLGCCAGDNPANLHKIVERFLDEPDYYREYSEYSRSYALKNHSPEKVFPKLLQCLDELCLTVPK